MCIIAIKPMGKKMFSENTIKTMFINNPDGSGYMYYDKKLKKVVIKKGFVTYSSLMNSLNSRDLTNTNVVLHFRIATSGKTGSLNCHPFPIYQKNKTKCVTKLAMAHNGILHNYIPPKNSEINDTQLFIKNVLSNLNPNFLNDSDKINLITQLIGTNKLAFLDDKNKVYTIGNFITDNGYMFSNGSYLESSLYPTYYKIPSYMYTNVHTKNKTQSSEKSHLNTSVCTSSTSKLTKNNVVNTKVCTNNNASNECVSQRHKLTNEQLSFWHDSPNEFWDEWDLYH